MATKFATDNMISSAVTAGENFLRGGWDFIARAAYLIQDAHDTKTKDVRKRTLGIRLMKNGEHSPATIEEYLRKAQVVADMWRFADVVPMNKEGAFVSMNEDGTFGAPLGFVEMLNYGAKDNPEEWAEGSIVQRIRALWGTINDIKRGGPPSERAPRKVKAKAEGEATPKPESEATPTPTPTHDLWAELATMGAQALAEALAAHELVQKMREALAALDAQAAEQKRKAA